MILCCKTCGNSFSSDIEGVSCDYCCGNTEVLFSDIEVNSIAKHDLSNMINSSREKYRMGNEEYNEDLWNAREAKESIREQSMLKNKMACHILTTGYEVSGYKIVDYKGVISGQIVLGTGFLSEFSASVADLFGSQSGLFSDKLEKAKNIAMNKLIEKSIEKGGNAVIGVDFDYITFANNMLGVVANGTSVIIEKNENR